MSHIHFVSIRNKNTLIVSRCFRLYSLHVSGSMICWPRDYFGYWRRKSNLWS